MFYRIMISLLLLPALASPYTIVRKDGKVFKGRLVLETAEEISVKDEDGVTIRFNKDQIDWDKTTLERQKEDNKPGARTRTLSSAGPVEVKREELRKKKWTGEPISVDFKDVDIRDLFRFLAETGNLNLVIDPGVKGTVTIKMDEVPWDQVLDVVCKMHGLGYTIDGNVVNVER